MFVWTRAGGAVERVSVAGDGSQAAAGASDASSISADGRYVAFASTAPNLVAGDTNLAADVFVHDRVTGSTVRASVTAGGGQAATASSLQPGGLSANGQVVAFDTAAPLAAGDTGGNDVYVRDLAAGTTERISVNSAGLGANGNSSAAAISADGRYVAFESSATNLDPADTGGDEDVFVRDRVAGLTRLVSASASPIQISQAAAISADARFVALATTAPDLAPGDTAIGFGTGWDVVRLASPFDPPADRSAPVVTCAADDGTWHADNVTLWCTAADAGSGLANAGQAGSRSPPRCRWGARRPTPPPARYRYATRPETAPRPGRSAPSGSTGARRRSRSRLRWTAAWCCSATHARRPSPAATAGPASPPAPARWPTAPRSTRPRPARTASRSTPSTQSETTPP